MLIRSSIADFRLEREVWPVCLLVSLIPLCLAPRSASAAVNVAILDYQDSWTSTKGLGQLLTDLGQSYTDITSGVVGGQAIGLAGYDTFIVGSFCTEQVTIRTALANAAATMREFVNNGGTIIVLTQADQTVAQEAWVQSPVRVIRGDPDFGTVYRVQTGHQIFSSPNPISDADVQGWTCVGTSTWPTSWESITTFEQCGVLAGNATANLSLATIVEAGWGSGRALFLSMALDKARNIGNAQAKTQAPRLMGNLLQYAENAKAGTVAPIVIYHGGGWSGPMTGRVFLDANGNGIWDAGEAGVAGVGVSDTVDLVLTAADGTYTLPNTAGNATLLYISLPSGYSKGSRWYQWLAADSPPSAFLFPLAAADETPTFDFAQITDLHIGGSGTKALLTSGLDQIASLKQRPAFILATGDLTNAGATLAQYDDYAAAVGGSQVRVFSVFGNHDANNSTSNNYRSYLGPDYYSFSYGDCHFLVLNSIEKTTRQANWVAKDLQLVRGTKRLFIFQHYSPSDQEYADFSSYGAEAVFSGHWHSQHTVQVNGMTSYNTPTFLFGGIDCSPAGFKVIHVEPTSISTKMKWLADGKRLQIVMPDSSLVIPEGGLQIVVNAYETTAEISSMHYQVKASGTAVAEGDLTRDSDWSWKGTVPAAQVPRGAYDLEVVATNDRNEVNAVTTSFMVLGIGRSFARPDRDWTQFGGGPQRGGFTPTPLEPPLGLVWLHQTGGDMDFGSPVVKDQTVYVGVKDRTEFSRNGVLALRAADGSQEWFVPTPAAVSHSVAVDAARVYACSHGGILHAFSRTDGQPAWSATLGSQVQRFQYSGPVLMGDQLFAGTYAWFGRFNAATGAEGWHQTYGSDWISCNACPAVSGNVAVVPADWATNSLRGVNASTGATLWQYTVHGVHGSPVISGDRVVFTDYDGQIHCADLNTGQHIWDRDLGGSASASTPAIAYGIVVAGGTGSIKGYRLSDGLQLWSFPLGTSAVKMSPYNNTFAALAGSATIADHTAYVPCGDGKLYALTLETGQPRWTMNFGVPLLSAPCICGQVMYLTAYDGNVYALAGRSTFGVIMDFDSDGDIDLEDFGHMQACLSLEGSIEVLPGCEDANLNGDLVVDRTDLSLFLTCFSGPLQPPPAGCSGS